jgi:hypothetical protein
MLLRIDDWYQDQSKQTVSCREMYRMELLSFKMLQSID